MSDPIRVGIIGASPTRGWALGAHLPALQALPEFELTAVATTRVESARATADHFGVPLAFGDPAELIAHPDVDLVTVSVKVPFHFGLVHAALEAGKHVYCEWPLGANLEEAIELATLADAQGVLNLVGLQGRRSPIVNYLRDLVADGYVGKVLYATLTVEGVGRGNGEVPAERVWAMDRTNGVTTLSIIGGHNLDVLRYVLGDLGEFQATIATRNPVSKVIETGETIAVTSPDVVLVQGRISGGAFASVTVQAGLPKGFGARLEIHGSDGVLIVTGANTLHLSDAPLTLSGAQGDGELAAITVPEQYRRVPDSVPDTSARNVAGLYLSIAEALSKSTKTVDPSFSTAVDLHSLLEGIEVSSATGGRQVIA